MKRWILIGMVVASGMTIQAQNKLPEKFPLLSNLRLFALASSDTAVKTSYNKLSSNDAPIPIACGNTVANPVRARP